MAASLYYLDLAGSCLLFLMEPVGREEWRGDGSSVHSVSHGALWCTGGCCQLRQ